MYLFDWRIDSLLQALLAPGMRLGISFPDPVPSAVIFLFGFTIAMVLLVILVGLPLMVRTISLVCQLRAARIVTWMGGLSWHKYEPRQPDHSGSQEHLLQLRLTDPADL